MATRKSTPKHEVVSADRRTVIISGRPRTECQSIASQMNKGVPKARHVVVRPVPCALVA